MLAPAAVVVLLVSSFLPRHAVFLHVIPLHTHLFMLQGRPAALSWSFKLKGLTRRSYERNSQHLLVLAVVSHRSLLKTFCATVRVSWSAKI